MQTHGSGDCPSRHLSVAKVQSHQPHPSGTSICTSLKTKLYPGKTNHTTIVSVCPIASVQQSCQGRSGMLSNLEAQVKPELETHRTCRRTWSHMLQMLQAFGRQGHSPHGIGARPRIWKWRHIWQPRCQEQCVFQRLYSGGQQKK